MENTSIKYSLSILNNELKKLGMIKAETSKEANEMPESEQFEKFINDRISDLEKSILIIEQYEKMHQM